MKTFVVFKKQTGEITNSYSLVDDEILASIPPDIIHAKKQVEDKLYTKEEYEQLRDSLL